MPRDPLAQLQAALDGAHDHAAALADAARTLRALAAAGTDRRWA